jgi:hypothetical protein
LARFCGPALKKVMHFVPRPRRGGRRAQQASLQNLCLSSKSFFDRRLSSKSITTFKKPEKSFPMTCLIANVHFRIF